MIPPGSNEFDVRDLLTLITQSRDLALNLMKEATS